MLYKCTILLLLVCLICFPKHCIAKEQDQYEEYHINEAPKTIAGVPGKPKIETVDPSEDSVKVSWSPPEELNGIITNYRITCINKEEGLHYSEEFGNVDKGEVTGMATCKEYEVTVAGKTSRGWGAESDPETVRLTSLDPVPSAPKNVQLIALEGGTSIEASWEAPDAAPMYYNLVCNGPTSVDEDVYRTTYIIKNLRPCSIYRVTVISVYPEDRFYADPVTTTTSYGAPGKPKNINCVKTTDTTVTVFWDPPNSNCVVDNYNLSWSWYVLWNDETNEGGSRHIKDNSFTITEITPWSSVMITVAAGVHSFFGESVNCNSITEQGYPGKPKIEHIYAYQGTIKVFWNPPMELNGRIDKYRIMCYDIEDGVFFGKDVGDVNEGEVSGLASGRDYEVTITAQTEKGWGQESDPVTVHLDTASRN